MSLVVSKTELDAVVDALEQDHESARDAAKAAVAAFLAVRDQRETWAVVHQYAGVVSAYGPYPTLNKVRDAAPRIVSGGAAVAARLRTHAEALALMEQVDAPAKPPKQKPVERGRR